MAVDHAKLDVFMGQLVAGPSTSAELAARTGTTERYVREWLRGQAAGGHVTSDPPTWSFSLSEEQAFALAREDSSAFIPGAFQVATAAVTERFFRPGYAANLVDSWLSALAEVTAKLAAGATVADVGCGHGASTFLMAQAFVNFIFVGFDYHAPSVARATRAAADAGVSERSRFEVASASTYPGTGYDLVASFDCLHDTGDPVGAAKHVRQSLAPDGTWLIVEPYAGGSGRGQPEPGRPVLQRLDAGLRAGVAVPGGRTRSRRAGRRGGDERRRHRRWFQQVPAYQGESIMTTHTTFDPAALSRAIEERDAQHQLALYSDDAEVRIIDRFNPPRSPRILVGKDAIRIWIEDVVSRDMTHRVANLVVGDGGVALTEECRYPDGTNVLCSCTAVLRGGLISKQSVVQVWDDPVTPADPTPR